MKSISKRTENFCEHMLDILLGTQNISDQMQRIWKEHKTIGSKCKVSRRNVQLLEKNVMHLRGTENFASVSKVSCRKEKYL